MRLLILTAILTVLSCSDEQQAGLFSPDAATEELAESTEFKNKVEKAQSREPAPQEELPSSSLNLHFVDRSVEVAGFSLKGSGNGNNGNGNNGNGSTAGTSSDPGEYSDVILELKTVVVTSISGEKFELDVNPENQVLAMSEFYDVGFHSLRSFDLDDGIYTQLRFVIEDASIMLSDGSVASLKVPSGSTNGIKLNAPFIISKHSSTVFGIDFNLRDSIKYNKGQGWMMTPVLSVDEIIPKTIPTEECMKGSVLTIHDGNTQVYDSIESALSEAQPNSSIFIGDELPITHISIEAQNGLNISGVCSNTVGSIHIKDSSNISVTGLEIASILEPIIPLEVQGSTDITITDVDIYPFQFSLKSVVVEDSNQIYFDQLNIDYSKESNVLAGGVLIGDNIESVKFTDSTISGVSGTGVYVGSKTGVEFWNSSISYNLAEGTNTGYGAHLGEESHFTLIASLVSNNSLSGLNLKSASYVYIEDSHISHNGMEGVRQSGYGVELPFSGLINSIFMNNNILLMNNGAQSLESYSSSDIRNFNHPYESISENLTSLGNEGNAPFNPYFVQNKCQFKNESYEINGSESDSDLLSYHSEGWQVEDSSINFIDSHFQNRLIVRPHTIGVFDLSLKGSGVVEVYVADSNNVVKIESTLTDNLDIGSYYLSCDSYIAIYTEDPTMSLSSVALERREKLESLTKLITPEDGGYLIMPNDVTLIIDEEVLTSDLDISIEKGPDAINLPPFTEQIGQRYELGPDGSRFEGEGIRVSVNFDKNALLESGKDPAFLKLAVTNEEGNWEVIDSFVDPGTQTVQGYMKHFSGLVLIFDYKEGEGCDEITDSLLDFPFSTMEARVDKDCILKATRYAVTEAISNAVNEDYCKARPDDQRCLDYQSGNLSVPDCDPFDDELRCISHPFGALINNDTLKGRYKIHYGFPGVRWNGDGIMEVEVPLEGWLRAMDGKHPFTGKVIAKYGLSMEDWTLRLHSVEVKPHINPARDFPDDRLEATITGFLQFYVTYFELVRAVIQINNDQSTLKGGILDPLLKDKIVPHGSSLLTLPQALTAFAGYPLSTSINLVSNAVDQMNPTLLYNVDEMIVKGDVSGFDNMILRGAQDALKLETGYTFPMTTVRHFVELGFERDGWTLDELSAWAEEYSIANDRWPTYTEIADAIVQTLNKGFYILGSNDQIYNIQDNRYCLASEDDHFYYGEPPITELDGVLPSIVLASRIDDGHCNTHDNRIQYASWLTPPETNLYCRTGETSSSGERKSCDVFFPASGVMRITHPKGYFDYDNISYDHYEGDGSEVACVFHIVEKIGSRVTAMSVQAHARSKKGYNAAAGWVDCRSRIPYFNGRDALGR